MNRPRIRIVAKAMAYLFANVLVGSASETGNPPAASVVIPDVADGPKRAITTDDLIGLRDIKSLSVSPDGSRFAIFVQQADVAANSYKTAWFVGDIKPKSPLTWVGDGGEVRFRLSPQGVITGDTASSPSLWSLDGAWIVYTLKRNGEVQLWRSRVDGSLQEQVSHSAADVRAFAWSADGRTLYYSAGTPRAVLQAHIESARREGFLYEEEFTHQGDIVHMATPVKPLEQDLTVWAVSPSGGDDRKAGEAGRAELERARDRAVDLQAISWLETPTKPGTFQLQLGASALSPVTSATGATAWLRPVNATAAEVLLPVMQLVMSKSPDRSRPVACVVPACTSFGFKRFWWSGDGKRVVFWLTDDGRNSHFYAWEPSTGAVKPILIANRLREDFRGCSLAAGDRLLCEREATTQPGHVASIDTRTGNIEVVADVNPEFRNIRLGRVEQVEWRLSKEVVDLGYPEMGNGNILYPPDFDPTRTYPLVLAPYAAMAFARGDEGDEFPLHVYAANGFVVLNAQFPLGLAEFSRKTLREAEKASTSAGKGYPQWTAFLESTVRGLDTIEAKGFVDAARVGMGGLSAGAATTMYMLLKYDRLTAASTSGTGDTPALYYFQTRLGFTGSEKRGGGVYTRSSMARPDTEAGLKYWKDIDIAFHVDEVEAPILIHSPDREVFNVLQLIRHLDEAGKPYEIYVFPDERHVKWQPAHRYAIYNRNLDWFRFWLQDYEDPAPAREEQYVRWRKLRELQCHNRRSLRDYCHVPATPH